MLLQKINLGKVAITIDKYPWDITKDYDKLVIVKIDGYGTYISRKPVPAGTNISDKEYWMQFSSLREDIVIDYEKFIKKYTNILKTITDKLDSNENRLIALENIKEDAKNLVDRSNQSLTKAEELLTLATNYIIKYEQIEKEFNDLKELISQTITLYPITEDELNNILI